MRKYHSRRGFFAFLAVQLGHVVCPVRRIVASRSVELPSLTSSSSQPFSGRGFPAGPEPADSFFRHIVAGMRNGVLAITNSGTVALLNEEGYRIFGVEPQPDDL